MIGDAVGSCVHREVGVAVALEVSASQVRFCGVADPTHFYCPIAETQESCSVARDTNYNVAGYSEPKCLTEGKDGTGSFWLNQGRPLTDCTCVAVVEVIVG